MKKIIFVFLVLFTFQNYSFGQAPTVLNSDEHEICAQTYSSQILVSNITFNSTDSCYITDIYASNFNSLTFYYDYNTNSYTIEGIPATWGYPPYQLTIDFESIQGTGSEIFTLTPKVSTINVIATDPEICDNETEFDLSSTVNHTGGYFSISQPPTYYHDGIIDPSKHSSEGFIDCRYHYTDPNGCNYTEEYYIDFQTPPPVGFNQVIHTSCGQNVGEITAWVDVTNYTSYWSNGVHNEDVISNLSAGDYYFNVIDLDNGCKNQASAIVENIGFEVTGDVSHVNCKGNKEGKIDLMISGGSGNYAIHWSDGQSTSIASGLSAGHHSVTVTDLDNGCVGYANFFIEEPAYSFEAYFYDADPTTCLADDGQIQFSYAIDGTEPYTYSWSTGATSNAITDLSSGQYSVVVTDSNNCESTYETTLNPYDSPTVWDYNIVHSSCNGNDGEINLVDVIPAAGDSITGYLWSNNQTTQSISNLSVGDYSLEITQRDGCSATYYYTIENEAFNYRPEICIVTVDTATNTNLVVWEKTQNNPHGIENYIIYRGNNVSGLYDIVDTVSYSYISVFNDVVASPERRSWKYRISAVNECGIESNLSRYHKTIHLVMSDGGAPDEKILSWDPYEGLDYFYYNLYRGTDVDSWQLIEDNIPVTSQLTFINTLPTGATEVDYFVEVVPTSGGCFATFGKVQDYNSSRSNKPSPIFQPGVGVGEFIDTTTNTMVYDNVEFKATVYPNPSDGNFKIQITDNVNNEKLNMTVVGINGNMIHQQTLNTDLNAVQLNVGSGIYFVQIQSKNTVENIRIVVQ